MKLKRMLTLAIFLAVVMAIGFGCATAEKDMAPMKVETTPDWMFHDIVDLAFVQQHVKIPMFPQIMLIDARPKRAKYDKGHIPMAVSIPDSQFEKLVDKLPQDKNALLIYYCGGLKCPLSHKSAKKAEKLGYTNVKVFAEGYPAWMQVPGHYPSVSADWIKQQIDDNADMVLVDSRPKRSKYDKGHIPTAISIPDSQFDKLTDQLPKDKTKTLVFYCGGLKCPLSHKSAKKAIALGYSNVKVFSAGYPGWLAVADKSTAQAAQTQIKSGKAEGSIDVGVFEKILEKDPDSILLIDVRDPEEVATGAFKTAVNIPSDKLEDEITSLPSNKPIVFVCATGSRSGEAYYMIRDMRPELKEVYYLEAEVTYNKDGSYKIVEPK
jgi:rhodanese-related sulfurtransferase